MKTKLFEEQHELDLEDAINGFLEELEGSVLNILYSSTSFVDREEHVFSFSAMIIYE